MSLFLRFEDARNATAGLLRVRGLHARIGLSRMGSLCAANPQIPLFDIFRRHGAVFCQPDTDMVLNTTAIAGRSQTMLRSGDELLIGTIRFRVYDTNPAAEVLAFSGSAPRPSCDATHDTPGVPALHFGIGLYDMSLPLLPNTPVRVGSSSGSTAIICLEGVTDSHCEIEFDGRSCWVTPFSPISLRGDLIAHRTSFAAPCTLILEPAGIPLKVLPPPGGPPNSRTRPSN